MVLVNKARVVWYVDIILDVTVDGKKYEFRTSLSLMFLQQHRYLDEATNLYKLLH